MKKMQRCGLKIIVFVALFVSAFISPSSAQIYQYRLKQADSLFQRKQYTQSLELYEGILQNHTYTPAMLLKMAYVHEGLNQVGKALYYLNLYYLATNDKATLEKMEQLSARYNLEGYRPSDIDRAFAFYDKFRMPVAIALAALMIFMLGLSVYIKRRKQQPVAPFVLMVFFALLLLVQIHTGNNAPSGIITQSNTYMLAGPSAGASVVSVVNAGHRVPILGHKDVWVKIEWKGRPVYIKQQNLLPVTL